MKCNKCGNEFEQQVLRTINVEANPELKAAVKDGSLFVVKCPSCGAPALVGEPVLYHDPRERVLVALTSSTLSSDGLEGYTCRLVSSVGELIEKVNIFDAGLDDLIIELCKYVTLQELGKDVELRFLRMDGVDGDITLAYPEKGEMQMVQIGYNVYSDCGGIISRNPALKEAATGLVRIDQNWLANYIA